MKRVAIVGAGPSGLSQLHAFQSAASRGAKIPRLVCYEKQSAWGGLWNYTWRTGVDEHGNTCHGSMYKHLWSNGPKEGLEFADYTFEQHFKKPIPSYPPRPVLFDYIIGRAKKAGIQKYIRFNSNVRDVEYNIATAKFTVTARDCLEDKETVEEYDHVIVASGHFSMPNVPYYDGFEDFSGRILHAHDFRDARQFAGQDILIVGSSYSAEDIGSQCWKYGSKTVTIAYRTKSIGYNWPSNIRELPSLVDVRGGNAYFKNGQSKKIDTIILCTGYKHYFSFLPDDLRLRTENRLATSDLYKGVVFNPNSALFYLGMQDQWYTFSMFDAQAWYVRDIILGKIIVPDEGSRVLDVTARQKAEERLEDYQAGICYQGAYISELINETDYPTFDIDAANRAFIKYIGHKKEGIMTFRDRCFKSAITGKLAPIHHTTWIEAMDDSLASYLKK